MTDIKLSAGFWRTRDGRKAEVVGKAEHGIWVGLVLCHGATTWNKSGGGTIPELDIIAPWHDPLKGEAWASIGSDDKLLHFYREEQAAKDSCRKYVRIRYEEIDGP